MGIFLGDTAPSKIFVGDTSVSKVFVGDTQVRPTGRLPVEYQEVEYIESSGTQHIDTGYIPNNNTKLVLKVGGWQPTSYWTYPVIFGSRLNWSSSGRGFEISLKKDTGLGYCMFGGTYDALTLGFGDGATHSIEMSQSGIYVDNTLKTTLSSVTFASPGNLYIFALNDNGTINSNCICKLYYTKIYDSGTLVRDLVPCYRIADSVIGLYDLVNDVFYTNAGTGTFTKGPDVN